MIAAFGNGWQWREPAWFVLLVLLPLLVAWRVRSRAGVRFAAAALVRDSRLPALPTTWRVRAAFVPTALHLVALSVAIAALARPVLQEPLPPERLGHDVLLCIDRSSSMAADDLAPGRTRLQVGVETAASFVEARRDDRVGFVEFARYADLRCPPTLDHAAVAELLGAVAMVSRDGPEDATGIGAAVAAAAAVLERSPSKGKVVVLLTDGEENVATAASPGEIAPLHAAQLCAGLGIRVHTIVLGRGNRKPDGRVVPLDTTAVQQLARSTHGRFFTANDAAALAAVWAEIDSLEAVLFAEPRVRVHEGFAPLLAAALLLAFVAHALARSTLEVTA